MATEKTEKLDSDHWDENGMARPGKNQYNDYNPTTRFHPSELPANPVARANFPAHLIDENSWTQSPMSDAPAEMRLARAEKAHAIEKERADRLQAQLDEINERAGARTGVGSVPDAAAVVQMHEDVKPEGDTSTLA